MARKYLPIHEAENDQEAHAIKGYLEKSGIKPVVRSVQPNPRNLGQAGLGQVVPPHLAPKGVYVKKEDMRRAQGLIMKYQQKTKKI